MPFGPFEIVLLALLAVMVFFMFRNSKKRRADQEALKDKMVPGAEVMTNFGLFGTLLSVDDDTNVASVETSPGTIVRVHRQTLSRVVEDEVASAPDAADELPATSTVGDDTLAAGSTVHDSTVQDSTVQDPSLQKPVRRAGKPDSAE
jgi:preprotein translocase subunit YajC